SLTDTMARAEVSARSATCHKEKDMFARRMLAAVAAQSLIAVPAMAQTSSGAEKNGHHYSGGPKTEVPTTWARQRRWVSPLSGSPRGATTTEAARIPPCRTISAKSSSELQHCVRATALRVVARLVRMLFRLTPSPARADSGSLAASSAGPFSFD